MCRFLIVAIALLISLPAARARQEAAKPQEKPSALRAEIQKLQQEMNEFGSKLQKEFQAAREKKDVDEQNKIRDRFIKGLEDFVARAYGLAEKHPTDDAAIEMIFVGIQSDPTAKSLGKGMALLIKDHAASPKIATVLEALGEADEPKVGELFRAVMDKNPDKNVQGVACLGLAKHLMARSEGAEGDEAVKLNKQAEEILALAAEKYADAKTANGTVGSEAKAILGLAIGKVAPNIEGVDTDGKAFKLSDYQGKVVLIDFWASWCGPCMRLVPHNLALMKKLEGKPFAVVGVNMDKEKEAAKQAISEHKIAWRSFHDDGGKIGSAWRVSAIPALFVIDAKGVMRHKWVGASNPGAIDEAIEALVKETEKNGAKAGK